VAGEPQLQRGSHDEDWVRYLQETLIAWRYDPGPVDGIFGPRTEAGVRAFQGDNADTEGNQLVVDCIVGPKTWGALTRGVGAYQADDAGRGESFTVDHPVTLVMQSTNNTCWAASSAMLLGFGSEDDVVNKVGSAGGDGANEPEMQAFTAALGLRIVAPMSMMPEGWGQLLNGGPVMVGIPYHYIVVAGIESDGTYGGTRLHVYDPAQGERWADYQVIENQYEIDAAAGANLIQR
jgi:Putative peptidoglycan binding domain/Papain-like cysteine protease AvrRpt2